MGNQFQFPFKNKLTGSTAYKATYVSPESILMNNDRVFPIKSVYIGKSTRVNKYKGVKTDAQIYLGRSKLFA